MRFQFILEKYFPFIIKIGIFIIAFIPFINFPSTFYPFIFSKGFLFQVIIEILFVFYFILILYKPEYRPRFNKLTITVFVFLGILLLSAIFGKDVIRSFWGAQERMGGVFFMFHLGMFFLILQSIFKTKKDWIWFFRFNIISLFLIQLGALFAKYEFVQKILFTSSQYSTLGNQNFLGAYLVFFVFLIPMLWILDNKSKQPKLGLWTWRIFYLLVYILNIIVLFRTTNRGAILGALLGLFLFFIFFIIFYPSKKTKSYKIVLAGSVLFIIFLSLFTFWVLQPKHAPSFLAKQTFYIKMRSMLSGASPTSRVISWKMGFDAWKERPLLGWGPENFGLAFEKKFDPAYLDIVNYKYSHQMFDKAHNIFIETLTTNGIIGLFAYLMIFVICFIKLLQKRKENAVFVFLLTSLLIAYFFQNLFGFDTPSSFIMFFTVLGFINYFSKNEKQKMRLVKIRQFLDKPNLKQVFIFGIFLIIILSLYYANLKSFRASQHTATAQAMESEERQDTEILGVYQKALSLKTPYNFEIKKYAAKYFLPVVKNKKLDQDLFNKLLWLSQELEQDIQERPNDPWTYFWLSQMYLLMKTADEKSLDKALNLSQKAVELAPKNYRFYYDLGIIYLEKHDCQKAEQAWQKALEYGETENKIKWSSGVCKIGQAKFKRGIQMLEEAIALGYNPNNKLFDLVLLAKVYGQVNNLDKSLEYYLKVLEKDNNNVEILVALASLYKARGEDKNARYIIEKIIRINPGLQIEAENFLQSIEEQ